MAARKARSVELNSKPNTQCEGDCNKEKRKEKTEDDICKTVVSVVDGLPIRCVGSWAMRKIHYLIRYFAIFSRSMNKHWEGLNYVEICSGVGRCVFRDNCEEVDGTALAILNHPNLEYLKRAIFIDVNSTVVDILNKRIEAANKADKARGMVGSYTDTASIMEALSTLSPRCLNFVLIDPTDCSVPFETIRTIKKALGKVDFLINVPIFMDAGRNLGRATLNPQSYAGSLKKYASFLGDDTFFQREDVRDYARVSNAGALRNAFMQRYVEQFRALGYEYCDTNENVQNNGRNLYNLFFASGHELALQFWRKATSYNEAGQISFLADLN